MELIIIIQRPKITYVILGLHHMAIKKPPVWHQDLFGLEYTQYHFFYHCICMLPFQKNLA